MAMANLTYDRTKAHDAAEAAGFIVIDKAELLDHYAEIRELAEGRGSHRAAAETAINFIAEYVEAEL